jgi:hypothetical protein
MNDSVHQQFPGDPVAIAPRSSTLTSATERAASRQRIAVPARLTWKDSGGAVRFASVVTRDLSDGGAFVECASQAPIPLFRLVHLQIETPGAGLTAAHGGGRVLAAVWRVENPKSRIGAPSGYALRFLVDPSIHADLAAVPRLDARGMAVAS